MCKATLAVFCFFLLGSQAMSEGQKEDNEFGNWEIRSEKTPKLSNTDKMLSLWETYIFYSQKFKLHTLRRLTDNIKFVLAKKKITAEKENNQGDGGRVDLIKMNMEMKEEGELVRLSKADDQVAKKMTGRTLGEDLIKIGGGHKEEKIEKKKKKNTGGATEEEKMSAWRKKMLRRMG